MEYHIRTDPGKCTPLRDETPGNNSTQARSTKIVFFGCRKIDRQEKKKEAKQRTERELMNKTSLYL